MSTSPILCMHMPLAQGLGKLFEHLEERLSLQNSIEVYIAGGMAVHLYTGARLTTDVDAEFSARIHVPNDLVVEFALEDGITRILYLDTGYYPRSGLLHRDYRKDSLSISLGVKNIQAHVLSPVDLALSKVTRLDTLDREDIAALVRSGLTSAKDIEARAREALSDYIGCQSMLQNNLREVLWLAHQVESRIM